MRTGIVELVAHLVESDSGQAENIHPYALGSTGERKEQELALLALLPVFK